MISPEKKTFFFIAFILILLSFLLYARSLKGPFVFDDPSSITQNPFVVKGKGLFFQKGFLKSRPVTNLSLRANYKIFRENPLGYHLTNVLLHSLVSLLVFFFALTLIRDFFPTWSEKQKTTLPFIVAVLFCIHPVQTEAVGYISGRSGVLAFSGVLFALLIYTPHTKPWGMRRLLAFLCFFLAFLAKEIAIIYPLLFLIWDFLRPQKDKPSRSLILKHHGLPLLLLGLLFLAALVTHGRFQAYVDFRPLSTQVLTQIPIVLRYLFLWLWPFSLNIDRDVMEITSVFSPVFLLSLPMLWVLFFLAYRFRKTFPLGLFCFCWFIVGFMPNSLVPLPDLMVERRLYLPSFSLALFFPCFVMHCLTQAKEKNMAWMGKVYWFSLALLIGISLFWSFFTIKRLSVYQSEIALWSDTVKKSPQKSRPHYNLANAYRDQAKRSKEESVQQQWFEKAIRSYQQAITVNPKYLPALTNLGHLYQSMGQMDLAEFLYEEALSYYPKEESVAINLGMLYFQKGQIKKAKALFSKVLQQNPYNAQALLNLGMLYQSQNNNEKALEFYQTLLSVNPQSAPAHNNICRIDFLRGRTKSAYQHCQKAIALDPNLKNPHLNLAEIYMRTGKWIYATASVEKLLSLDNQHPRGWYLLGKIALKKKQTEQARLFFQNALRSAQKRHDKHFQNLAQNELAKL